MDQKNVLTGWAIVIAERGFVFVGDCEVDDKYCVVKDSFNIRRWGTTKGLGELAIEGTKKDTILDAHGTVRIPIHSVVSIIDTRKNLWVKN